MFIFQKGTFVRKKGGGGGCFFNFWGCVCLLALLAMMRRRKSAASMCSRGMIISWFAIFDQVPWNLVYFAYMNFQSYFWFFLSFWNPTSPNFRAASYRRRSSPCDDDAGQKCISSHQNILILLGKEECCWSISVCQLCVLSCCIFLLSVYLDFCCCNLSYRHFCSKAVSSLPNLYELTSILAIGHSLGRWHSRLQLSWWKKQNHSLWTSMSEDHAPLDNP